MQAFFKLCLVTAAAAATLPALADGAQLQSVVAAGNGCPAGSVDAHVDGDTLTLSLPPLAVTGGTFAPRANCSVSLSFAAPGQQVAIKSVGVDYQGTFTDGAAATFKSFAWIQGETPNFHFATLTIGSDDDFGHVDLTAPDSRLAWTPCTAERALNLSLAVTLPQSVSADDSASVTLTGLQIKTRPCE